MRSVMIERPARDPVISLKICFFCSSNLRLDGTIYVGPVCILWIAIPVLVPYGVQVGYVQ